MIKLTQYLQKICLLTLQLGGGEIGRREKGNTRKDTKEEAKTYFYKYLNGFSCILDILRETLFVWSESTNN